MTFMRQGTKGSKNERQSRTAYNLLLDDSQVDIEEDGDNPSKQKLGNQFLRTELIASWNILQEKTINFQELGNLFSNLGQMDEQMLKKQPSQNKQNMEGSEQKRCKSTVALEINRKIYRPMLASSYQNMQIDVSSFIKIKTQDINGFYQLQQKVGEGAFGNVYRGIERKTGEVRAIKVLKRKSMSNKYKICLIAEIDLLKTLDHPNIIKLYDLFLHNGDYYVVTQFCQGGCLRKYFDKKKGQIKEDTIRIIMKQLLSVLNYLNNSNVVHRDLKLDNIVFLKNQTEGNSDFQLKIIDFGTAIRVRKHKKNQSGLVGTLFYIAPQFTRGFFTQKCDIWSAGVILYQLLFEDYPFKGKNQKQVINQIVSKNIQWDKINKKFSQEVIKIVQTMLNKNYLARASAKTLMQNDWIRNANTLKASKQMSESTAHNLALYNRKNNFVSLIESFLSFKKITQEERQELSKMFFQIDSDHSGLIQIHQLIQFYRIKFPECKEQDIVLIVQNIDKNKSGKIDFNEFITAMTKKNELFIESALRQAFDYIDNDKTGYITKKELKKLLQFADKRQIEEVFQNLDQNKDNEISFQQFSAYLIRS